jgi:hypothetical protein
MAIIIKCSYDLNPSFDILKFLKKFWSKRSFNSKSFSFSFGGLGLNSGLYTCGYFGDRVSICPPSLICNPTDLILQRR